MPNRRQKSAQSLGPRRVLAHIDVEVHHLPCLQPSLDGLDPLGENWVVGYRLGRARGS